MITAGFKVHTEMENFSAMLKVKKQTNKNQNPNKMVQILHSVQKDEHKI